MKELSKKHVQVEEGFWGERLAMNAETAIFHQWEQLEKTGCIENFRLVADKKEGIREGFFFADSDAYKWLDAAARIYASHPSGKLKKLMDDFIDLIGRTQEPDGYIYTYKQLFFPDERWTNLQIEHELYCHGHLIEAAVSHFEATGETALLEIAEKAAQLLLKDFADLSPKRTPGHEEIEIALIKLYHTTGKQDYLNLAEKFIEQRGRFAFFGPHILGENSSFEKHNQTVTELQEEYYRQHPEHAEKYKLPPDNAAKKPESGALRWLLESFTGRYFQQNRPIRKQTVPTGHAVRFTYLTAAAAMLYRARQDASLLPPLATAWERMVTKRMYVTGGIGSLPNTEGFGRDYELDPEYSYSETCAALGSMLWSWEMLLSTGEAKYADLFEWQLYNAASVGLGQDGTSYLYNNPLACREPFTRHEWFKCPCCPSNISRIWADLGSYIYTFDEQNIWVHQYIDNRADLPTQAPCKVTMQSALPWQGKVQIELSPAAPAEFTLHLRIPSWSKAAHIRINGEPVDTSSLSEKHFPTTASGYDPRTSQYLPIERTWQPGDVIEIEFETMIELLPTHPKVKATLGQFAVTYGPLVYCLESVDDPQADIFSAVLDPNTFTTAEKPELLGGITTLQAEDSAGHELTLIPYYVWANREPSTMTVYLQIKSQSQ